MSEKSSFSERASAYYNRLKNAKGVNRREVIKAAGYSLGGAAVALAAVELNKKDTTPTSEKERQTRFATGIDISYPQGSAERYAGQHYDFVVVGVNGGRPTDPNPHLVEQLRVAAELTKDADPTQTGMPPIHLYLNTANPLDFIGTPDLKSGPEASTEETPYGVCDGSDSQACMYAYGWQRAKESIENMFTAAATEAGVSADPTDYMVWLDVETYNSWRENPNEGENPQVSNRIVLEGMVAYLESINIEVGLYSVRGHWNEIIGDTVGKESNLYTLPSWVAAGSASEAEVKKMLSEEEVKPLTGGGKVVMIQRVEGKDANDPDAQDYNYAVAAD